ncbi:MAG: plastocyanin/azurin family copper-binding protein [Nitrosopumilaceae archaeon]|nr:plastocyanin/azurin family copper-binding protein [Nitrosopumilaceae archaeon]
MKRLIIISSIITATILLGVSFTLVNSDNETELTSDQIDVDVIMPTKVSRPGCEIENLCYIPPTIQISKGEKVIWQNQDSAFHSVTSGKYDSPTNLFDSGHMDPDEIFIVEFTERGIFDYYCTLHPWMEGQVIVK